MKVIINNFKPEWPREAICTSCGSILEYDKGDIIEKSVRVWEKGVYHNSIVKVIKCPCCNYFIALTKP